MPETDDDVETALRQALDTNRTFDDLTRRYSTLQVVAEDPEAAAAYIDLIARILDRELQASTAASEAITGLSVVGGDIEAACIKLLDDIRETDGAEVWRALPTLARATHRAQTQKLRADAAECCLAIAAETSRSIPADHYPAAEFQTGFKRGGRVVRANLTGTRGATVNHGDVFTTVTVGHGGVFRTVANHAPEKAASVVAWLLEHQSFEYVDHRLAFQRAVTGIVADAPPDETAVVVDTIVDHLTHEHPRVRQEAAEAFGDAATDIPTDRVDAVMNHLLAAAEDDDEYVRRDVINAITDLIPAVPIPSDRVLDQFEAAMDDGDSEVCEAVLSGVDAIDYSKTTAVEDRYVDLLLAATDHENERVRSSAMERIGGYLNDGGQRDWTGLAAALLTETPGWSAVRNSKAGSDGAASKIAALTTADVVDATAVNAVAEIAAARDITPGRAVAALVAPPSSIPLDRTVCQRDILVACFEASTADEASRRQCACRAAEAIVAVANRSAIDGTLDAFAAPSDSRVETVTVRTHLLNALPPTALTSALGGVAADLTHDRPAVRERAVSLAADCFDRTPDPIDSDIAAALVDRITDDSDDVRRTALKALPAHGDELPTDQQIRLIDHLLAAITDDSPSVRRRAAAALVDAADWTPAAQVDDVSTVALLGIRADDKKIRTQAAATLESLVPRLNEEAVDPVVETVVAAAEEHEDTVFDGLDILWKLADSSMRIEMIARGFAALLGASTIVRDHFQDTSVTVDVSETQVEQMTDGLLTLVQTADTGLRRDAIRALHVLLSSLSGSQITPVFDVLNTAMVDDDPTVQSAAFDALETTIEIADTESLASLWPTLRGHLDHDDWRVRRGAVTAIGSLADRDVPVDDVGVAPTDIRTDLDGLLADPEHQVRVATTTALPAIAAGTTVASPNWAVERIREQTGDDSRHVRLAATDAATTLADRAPETADDLVAMLAALATDDSRSEVRQRATEALFSLPGVLVARVVDATLPALDDDTANVREQVIQGLHDILRTDGCSSDLRTRILNRLLQIIKNDATADVRVVAVEAVDTAVDAHPLGEDEHLDTDWIAAALVDDTSTVRQATLRALPTLAPHLSESGTEHLLRRLIKHWTTTDGSPADTGQRAVQALSETLHAASDPTVERYLFERMATDSETPRETSIRAAMAMVDASPDAAATEAINVLLDQLATTPWKTGPFGERRQTPQIEAARDLLDGVFDRATADVAVNLDSSILPEYLRHDRELVRRSAASLLAALVVHTDISLDAVDCRGTLQTCLRDTDLDEAVRLALLELLSTATPPAALPVHREG